VLAGVVATFMMSDSTEAAFRKVKVGMTESEGNRGDEEPARHARRGLGIDTLLWSGKALFLLVAVAFRQAVTIAKRSAFDTAPVRNLARFRAFDWLVDRRIAIKAYCGFV
jgi:hypothetical protein